jgi:hypothetical protein
MLPFNHDNRIYSFRRVWTAVGRTAREFSGRDARILRHHSRADRPRP